jgi:glycosyltransferase involved in cell wall biosynthesis
VTETAQETREETVSRRPAAQRGAGKLAVGLLSGSFEKHYSVSLSTALAGQGVDVDLIGSAVLDCPPIHSTPGVTFRNLYWDPNKPAGLAGKLWRVLAFYRRLFAYAATAKPKVFHLLWNNKFEVFDRTVLMLYYKLLGKKVTLTAHNVNVAKRDKVDSLLNRLTLRMQYHLMDHIFVHTERMKGELLEDFGVRPEAVTVVPHGVNNAVPNTELTTAEAKRRLGIEPGSKTILFFGMLRPYKGLDVLVDAFHRIADKDDYRLLIAGEPKKDSEAHLREIQERIAGHPSRERVLQKLEYIPDEQTELYFKAADVLALPYHAIFQSGVLLLSYSFGLPVVATDVGSFRADIVEGETGYICPPRDPAAFAEALETYFGSELFGNLEARRKQIQDYIHARNSWEVVSEKTRSVYASLLAGRSR